jgi:hypothetical protein
MAPVMIGLRMKKDLQIVFYLRNEVEIEIRFQMRIIFGSSG